MTGADPTFEETDDLPPHLGDPRIRPPGSRKGKVMQRGVAAAVKQTENPVVQLDQLGPLPLAPRVIGLAVYQLRRRPIRDIDAERTEDMGTQRCAAVLGAEDHHDRPQLARDFLECAAPRQPRQQ